MRAGLKITKVLSDFAEIKCFKLKTNHQIIIGLKYQIPPGRSPSLWRFCESWLNLKFPLKALGESCAVLTVKH